MRSSIWRAGSSTVIDQSATGAILHGFLGILRVARDPCGEAVGAVTIGAYQVLGGRRITAAKGRHERAIPVDPCRHAWAFPMHLCELSQCTPLRRP